MDTEIDYKELVRDMRNAQKYFQMCVFETDLLKKCILCKKHLTPSQWSCVLEDYIKSTLNIGKRTDNRSGDGCSRSSNYNVEIKVSLGDLKGNLHFVQLRPDHKIDFYVFLVYNMFEGELGQIYWFLCKPHDLYKLLPEYGGYAHGTKDKLGKITKDNIFGRNYEYALRPHPNAKNQTKGKQLWDIFVKEFNLPVSEILSIIGEGEGI